MACGYDAYGQTNMATESCSCILLQVIKTPHIIRSSRIMSVRTWFFFSFIYPLSYSHAFFFFFFFFFLISSSAKKQYSTTYQQCLEQKRRKQVMYALKMILWPVKMCPQEQGRCLLHVEKNKQTYTLRTATLGPLIVQKASYNIARRKNAT